MTKSPMSVCFTFDENYVRPAWVAVNSLLSNKTTVRNLHVYLITDGNISDKWKDKFLSLNRPGAEIFVHSISSFNIELPKIQIRHLNSSAIIRLFLDQIIDAPRVIYFDVDLLVCDDVESLFVTDLQGKTIAAARDSWATNLEHQFYSIVKGVCHAPKDWQHRRMVYGYLLAASIGKPLFEYFNSGVMLIDLERFSEKQIGEKALQRLQDHYCFCADQCALNYVLNDDWLPLASSWNTFRCNELICTVDLPFEQLEYFAEGRQLPRVIHFPGPSKPWGENSASKRNQYSIRANLAYGRHPAAKDVFDSSNLLFEEDEQI